LLGDYRPDGEELRLLQEPIPKAKLSTKLPKLFILERKQSFIDKDFLIADINKKG